MVDGWIELFDVETDEAGVLFFSIDSNQLITAVVFFHWLKLRFFAIVLLMRSRIFLLTLLYIYIYIYVLNKVILFNIYIEQSYFTASPNLRCLLCRRRLYCGGRWTQIGKKDVISKRLRVYCLVTIPKFLPFYSWIKYFNLFSSSWRYKCLIWGLIIQ